MEEEHPALRVSSGAHVTRTCTLRSRQTKALSEHGIGVQRRVGLVLYYWEVMSHVL